MHNTGEAMQASKHPKHRHCGTTISPFVAEAWLSDAGAEAVILEESTARGRIELRTPRSQAVWGGVSTATKL